MENFKVGDATGDDKPDLVAREITGTLWLYPVAGNGRFGGRLRIGWNAYTSLF
ncbi:hypothetical protein ACFYMW_31190 [Streptomyces sp. NPDC006692]|uniref:hypothetical protein n=1 Tax=unclassified Streptomyces TaxID=2593676 RepID=UPI00368AE166